MGEGNTKDIREERSIKDNTAEKLYITICSRHETSEKSKEYLQRTLVEDMTYIFSPARVSISCSHTHYAGAMTLGTHISSFSTFLAIFPLNAIY